MPSSPWRLPTTPTRKPSTFTSPVYTSGPKSGRNSRCSLPSTRRASTSSMLYTAFWFIGTIDGRSDSGYAGSAGGGIGAVDPGEDRDAELLELGVTEERGAVAPAVGVHLVLLRQLHARAVHEPHERHVQALGEVRHAQLVLRLTRDPRAGEHLV